MSSQFEIFLDMDGVMVDLEYRVGEVAGKNFQDMTRGEVHRVLDQKGIFSSPPMMHNFLLLFDHILSTNIPFQILTATGSTRPEEVQEEKKEWIRRNLGERYLEIMNFVEKSNEKGQHAQPHIILIDDREKAVHPFIDNGGIGIIHKSPEKTIQTLTGILSCHE